LGGGESEKGKKTRTTVRKKIPPAGDLVHSKRSCAKRKKKGEKKYARKASKPIANGVTKPRDLLGYPRGGGKSV